MRLVCNKEISEDNASSRSADWNNYVKRASDNGSGRWSKNVNAGVKRSVEEDGDGGRE